MAFDKHIPFIRQTYELASDAVKNGNHPFGALLVYQGDVVLTAVNTVNDDNDGTRHAEVNLLQLAAQDLSQEVRSQCVLYTSTEPCIMCSAAIYWSGYSVVVYGTAEATMGQIAGSDFLTPSREIFAKGEREITVIGPVLDEEGAIIHAEYWNNI